MTFPTWMLWLAGTLLPLAIWWLLWRLALRPERCYGYNRALLLLAPLLAAALPLLPRPALPTWLAGSAGAGQPVASVLLPALTAVSSTVPIGPGWSGWPWLLALYGVGVALGLGRLAGQVLHLWRLAHRLPRLDYADYTLVRTGGRLPTSSFGRVVFWDETTALAPAEVAAVLAHELAHVRQRHTLAVLWLEAWRAVLWPNPFAHLLLPALRLTHELLADQAAATSAEAAAVPYPVLLARLAARRLAGPEALFLLQPFAFSATLTRIAMLTTQVPVRRWKQWLVLPVLAGLYVLANYAASAQVPAANTAARKAASRKELLEAWRQDSLAGGQNKLGVLTIRRDAAGKLKITHEPPPPPTPIPGSVTPNQAGVYTYVEQMPELPGGGHAAAIVKQIQSNLIYPAGASQEGRVFASFIVNATGDVRDAKIIKGLTQPYDEAVLASIQKLPRFVPGQQGGRPVAVSFTVPILFARKP